MTKSRKWLRYYLAFLFLIASSGVLLYGWAFIAVWLYGKPDQFWPDIVVGILLLFHLIVPWMWGTIKVIEKIVPELA